MGVLDTFYIRSGFQDLYHVSKIKCLHSNTTKLLLKYDADLLRSLYIVLTKYCIMEITTKRMTVTKNSFNKSKPTPWSRINRGLENSVKYNKRGVGINRGLFVYFAPNDVSVSTYVHMRTKL